MKHYQKRILKIVVIIALFGLSLHANAQVYEYRLKMADSLYQAKKFTQSLDLYREIFAANTFSPAMLLRMAYIEEGLGQMPQALYYISLYYEVTHNQQALNKMEEMAARYNLSGYESNQTEHALNLINENKPAIVGVMSSICLFFIALMIYTVKRKHIKPYVSFSFFLLTAIILISFINFNFEPRKGITKNSPAFLMSGPSSGAKVVGIVTDGHRLPIVGKSDVWVRVNWNGTVAYLKENQVLEVKL